MAHPVPRNGVSCTAIEHKMGIKASATCALSFDGAKGWLVGEPHKGLRAMFTMMNTERLSVGIQGLGVAEVAYQNAVTYARERLQGRSLTGAKYPEKPADPIIVHPGCAPHAAHHARLYRRLPRPLRLGRPRDRHPAPLDR